MTNNFTKIVAYDEHGNIYTLWDSSEYYKLNNSETNRRKTMDNFFDNFTKVIVYDVDGVTHVLYDGNAKAVATYPTMPKLETGMFIILDLTDTERKEKHYGFVYDNKIIWQKGGWDEARDIHADKHREDDMKAKLTIYEKDKIYYFPKDNYKDYILWTGEVWYG